MQADTRLTVTLVAGIFGKSEKTIYKWIDRKPDFPARGDDGKFSELEVLAYASKNMVPTLRRG